MALLASVADTAQSAFAEIRIFEFTLATYPTSSGALLTFGKRFT
jgi:hypothetical protein